ncbi:MAG: hypothetical protein KGL53_08495, partial [Elusimicrobia bacterium]|nr:hypothetical protein [Elusimicrobiota bacterium]
MLLTPLLLPALLGAAPLRAAEAPDQMQAQVQLESSQESRLQTVLRKVLATDDVLVIVDMDVATESHPRLTELLPGVPIKDSPAADEMPSVTSSRVRSVAATVILDDALPKADDALAQETADKVLGLDPARGDSVTIRRMRLRPQLAPHQERKDWITPGPAVALLWLLGALAA